MPAMTARIEQKDAFARSWIEGREIGSFEAIAPEAREREIPGNGVPAVFHGNDVIDFKRQRIVLVRHLAVFATALRARPHQLFERALHGLEAAPKGSDPFLNV
jgi:hypothetical protein